MLVLAVALILSTAAAIVVASLQAAARRRLAIEGGRVAGLLTAARSAQAQREEEALRAQRGEEALRRELERLAAELASAARREADAAEALRAREARLAELGEAIAAETARATEMAQALAGARGDVARAVEREQHALVELSQARAESREDAEARQRAEEGARQARTTKDAYSGEVRLLREELARATAKLEEATLPGSPPSTLPLKEKPPPPPLHVTAWACAACGTVGRQAVKDCCFKAGLSGALPSAPKPEPSKHALRAGGRSEQR
jgi:hypothetical protein